MASFQKIVPVSASSWVAKQILDAIREGDFVIGSKLPSERVMAQSMGTSRNCVREGLSLLKALGIIEIRRGAGSYVTGEAESTDIPEVTQQADLFIEETQHMLSVWEARKQIEIGMVKLAIGRSPKSDLQDATDALSLMREAADRGDPRDFAVANERFHIAIGGMAGNAALLDALRALIKVTMSHLAERVSWMYVASSIQRSLQKHQAILSSVARKDYEGATEAIRFHFHDLEVFFCQSLEQPKTREAFVASVSWEKNREGGRLPEPE